MKGRILLSESKINDIVKNSIQRILQEELINKNVESDARTFEHQQIPHTERAFMPGDVIMFNYAMSIGGKLKKMKLKGVIENIEGNSLKCIVQDGEYKGKKVSVTSKVNTSGIGNVIRNNAWEKPVKNFLKQENIQGEVRFKPDQTFIVDYETFNGIPCVSIEWRGTNYLNAPKKYYRHDTGEYVGQVSTDKSKTAKWGLKNGQTVPIKCTQQSFDNFGYVPVEEEWFYFKNPNHKEAVWDTKYFREIMSKLPWLRQNDVWWKLANASEPKLINIAKSKQN